MPDTTGRVVAVVAAGGAIGALARCGLGVLWPHRVGEFPWTTFGVYVGVLGARLMITARPGRGRR
jgi:CrcB protein